MHVDSSLFIYIKTGDKICSRLPLFSSNHWTRRHTGIVLMYCINRATLRLPPQ